VVRERTARTLAATAIAVATVACGAGGDTVADLPPNADVPASSVRNAASSVEADPLAQPPEAPAGWPADAPLPAGLVVTSGRATDGEAVLDGTLPADTGLEALQALVADLAADGWTIDLENLPALGPGTAVLASLDTRAYRAEVTAATSDGRAPIRISVNT
jgi:hypothetical protein